MAAIPLAKFVGSCRNDCVLVKAGARIKAAGDCVKTDALWRRPRPGTDRRKRARYTAASFSMGLAGMSDSEPISPYQRVGGAEAVRELVQRFYAAFAQTALHLINR